MAHLTVGLREEPTLLPLVDALPPALADISPGDGEQLAGPQLDLARVRLRLKVVQRRRLSVQIAAVGQEGNRQPNVRESTSWREPNSGLKNHHWWLECEWRGHDLGTVWAPIYAKRSQ